MAEYDWFNTLALIINKFVASLLLGVARLYLIIIVHNAAPVSQAHKKLEFCAESAMCVLCSLTKQWCQNSKLP